MDVDLAVHLQPAEVEALAAVFPPADYYVPPLEVAIAEVARPVRGHFNVIHLTSGQKADFYPSRNHPYLTWAWEHRQQGRVDGEPVWFAPREYVILWKLEFYASNGVNSTESRQFEIHWWANTAINWFGGRRAFFGSF